jgi:hypothetical protein
MFNRADLLWLKKFIDNYGDLLSEYPEIFKKDEEDDWKVAQQIIKEKLNEQA